jgi:hypothetical protein
MPSEPTPGRVYVALSVPALIEPFGSHTTAQAKQLVAAYKGKWLRVAGTVHDVSQSEFKGRWTVTPDSDPNSGWTASLALIFTASWKDHISVLRRGDPVVADGQLSTIESWGVILEDCELVGVAPPSDPTPARQASAAAMAAKDARLARTAAMFDARLAYVIAWHRQANNWRALKKVRLDLERQYPQDLPDVVLSDAQEWRDYIETEKRVLAEVRAGSPRPPDKRVDDIEAAKAQVDRLIDLLRLSDE